MKEAVSLNRIFDAPLVTSDQSWDRVLTAGLPVALILHDGRLPSSLEESMGKMAAHYAGDLLLVKADLSQNPALKARYGVAEGPAVVAIREGQVVSKGDSLTPDLLRAHVEHLLGKGPAPTASQARKASKRPGEPVVVTDSDFDRGVIQADLPVLVDFWAPWCGPCRMVEPIVARLAREAAGELRVAKLNVDENPRIAARYGIRGIPSMMIFERGQVIDQWTGALPEGQLRARLSRWIRK
jgi:thioredoxin 1